MTILLNLYLLLSVLGQICAFMVVRESGGFIGRGSGLLQFHSFTGMVGKDKSRLSAGFEDEETSKEQSRVDNEGEMTQDLLMKRLGMDEASNPGFDAEMLPLPLFTSLVIFIGSTILTLYGIYVGIFGFPVEGP